MALFECTGQRKLMFVNMAVMLSVVVALAQKAPNRHEAAAAQRAATCADRDLQLVSLIEQRGNAQDVAGHILFGAWLAMMAARKACIEGRESEALAIYNAIARNLARAAR
jgi:hypothetical protein